ncbi:MAG: transglutaminase domain-containing protein [Lachnospiraceae bacterium]|nr:transglutaminase domain-containing protein [Lachnospiraceae bacterium]
MKHNFRKLKTSLLAVSLIFILTACGAEDTFTLSDWREFFRLEFRAFRERIGLADDGNNSSRDDSSLFDGFNINPDISVEVHEEDPSPGEDEVTEVPTEGLSGFYYGQLSENRQKVYDQLYTGISERKSEFFIYADDDGDCGPALNALVCDHPEFFWIDGNASIYGYEGPGAKKITLEFNIDAAQIDYVQAVINEAVQEYIYTLPEDASSYQKVKAAYDYVIRRADYQLNAPQAQNIQSVFLSGQSVCAGYTRAFQYLLSKVGIYSAYIAGTVEHNGVLESHAWSMVDIDGTNYLVDVTWGDPNYEGSDVEGKMPDILYNYLCLTTEDMERATHIPDPSFNYPVCESRDYNYYLLNGYYYEYFDREAVAYALNSAVENGGTSAHFKFSNFDEYAAAVYAIFDDGLLNDALQLRMRWDGLESMSYYPMNDDALCTIDIYW